MPPRSVDSTGQDSTLILVCRDPTACLDVAIARPDIGIEGKLEN